MKIRAKNGRDTYVGPMSARKRKRLLAKAARRRNRKR
jgi:hypothetical protein